jgi:uncharacterized repeat protein (TIGR02543 family)
MKNQLSNIHTALRRAFALPLAATLALAGGLQASTVTETFDTAESTAANGWTGSGNTNGGLPVDGNNFGWFEVDNVLGTPGEAGGIFARSLSYRYFADTNGGTLSRTGTLVMSGSFYLENSDFDGTFKIGFFNTAAVATNFVGIAFSEPSGGIANPFRGYAEVAGTGGASSGPTPIELNQAETLTYNLTWTGQPDGSGTLSGTLAGTAVNVAVAAGSGTFNAFGIVTGGMGTNVNENTGPCFFDDLTYTEVTPVTVTITFNGNQNDSGTVPDSQTINENQPLTLSTNSGNLARTGFTFTGWNTAADGSGTTYAEGASFSTNTSVTLYARWSQSFTITYDGNGNDSGTVPDPQVMLEGVPAPLATNSGALDRTGFTFTGWNTAADGSGTRYAAGASYTANANVTLFASWGLGSFWINTTTSAPQQWGTAANWNPAAVPSAAGAVVNFTAPIAAGQTVALASTRTVGTLNLGLAGNLNRYSFSNTGNGVALKANAEDTLGTATINVNNNVAEVDGHTFQGTIRMEVENVNLNINAAGGRLNFSRWLIDTDGDSQRSPTMTLSAVQGAGVFQFGIPAADTTNRNQWGKLVVNQYATCRNSNPNDTGGGVVNDRALGRALTSYLADAITLNGGTLQGSNASLNYNISANRGITLGALGGTLQRSWTVDSVITGPGGLTLSLGGTVTLNALNTYEGGTIVNDATLIVTGGSAIPDSGKLVINTGGKVNPSGTTETVSSLFFDGVQQATGTWGATDSGAANINDTYFTGTGVINVVPYVAPSGFANWQAANSTAGGLNDDHDNDGVDNGVEWFLGGNTDTTGFTPLPGVVDTAGTLSITWTQSADFPGTYGTDFRVETSATLANPWTPATEGIGAGFVEINGNNVKYTFPAGVGNFARLVITGP